MNNPWVKIPNPNRDVNVLRVSESHPLSMYWGKETQGRYLFIYEMDHQGNVDDKKLPRLDGILLKVIEHEHKCRLVMLLNNNADWELFYSLCLDLIKATLDLPDGVIPFSIILRRLSRWQAFLRRRRSNLLSGEEIKGLIGELLFIEEAVSKAFGWHQAVSFWKGPEEASQDFMIHDTAVEVKCQTGGSKSIIPISSAEQLTPQALKGYLAVYTITTASASDSTSFSLNELVDRIQVRLELESPETQDRFDELLCLTGYVPREEYDDTKFRKIDLVCYEIRNGFPRIIISEINPGIENISYSIKLEACRPYISNPDWWEKIHD